jgi:hypothetical protein
VSVVAAVVMSVVVVVVSSSSTIGISGSFGGISSIIGSDGGS